MKNFLIGVSLFSFALHAQFPGSGYQHTVRGQVVSDKPVMENYTVELHTSAIAQSPGPRAYTTSTGDFQLQGVSEGDYQLIVTNNRGQVVQQQLLRVDNSGAPVEVRLPSQKADQPPSGRVTLAALAHKVPKKAQKELKAAEKARERGDHEESIQHFQKALEIDGENVEAHNDLATEYISVKQYDSALAELDYAEKLDPSASVVPMNRAVCLMAMGRMDEAESAARRAVQLNGASPKARYALGLVLANERKFTQKRSTIWCVPRQACRSRAWLRLRFSLTTGAFRMRASSCGVTWRDVAATPAKRFRTHWKGWTISTTPPSDMCDSSRTWKQLRN